MQPFVLADPRFAEGPEMQIAGLSGEYTRETSGEIPAQWDRFNPQLNAAGLGFSATWGVVYPLALMRYISGVELPPGTPTPEGWEQVTIPAQHYAIFAGKGGVPSITASWYAIFGEWASRATVQITGGPMLEHYGPDWPQTGAFEIWVPVA